MLGGLHGLTATASERQHKSAAEVLEHEGERGERKRVTERPHRDTHRDKGLI